jgi:hypothetical protein
VSIVRSLRTSDLAVAQPHAEPPLDHEEELADDARAPRLREALELLCDVDLPHTHSLPPGVSWTTALRNIQDPERDRGEQLYGPWRHETVTGMVEK